MKWLNFTQFNWILVDFITGVYADSWFLSSKARVEFLRRQNKSREALARVKQIYAKTHVTARLRSWWYLMQRDHTDTQFKRLSENLETAEAKLEGTRGAVIRHEKATAEQARNLQYRLLAVEKGLETAEKEKATKHEVQEGTFSGPSQKGPCRDEAASQETAGRQIGRCCCRR